MTILKIGDVVQLKSGGPLMTVTYAKPHDSYVEVNWFYDGKVCFNKFPSEALELQK